jgi:hypothetical protein
VNILHITAPHRPDHGFDRDAIARRNAQAFDNGDRRRRHDTAHQLEQLAREIRKGEHGELVLAAAARLLGLRGGR